MEAHDVQTSSGRATTEVPIDILFALIGEILGEVLFGVVGAVLQEAVSDEDQSQRVAAAAGHLLLGAVAGVVSLLLLRQRIVRPWIPGVSLILAPLGTGVLLDALGRSWVRRGNVRMALFTFRGGMCFGLGMAIVRFVYVERAWTWL
jgi:uncharacterized membrane protein YeaQ/YmgE (transglycosylase-associated protein family)